jgi:glycosyltransferase involved in cell wall biosynthesis
LSKKKIKVFTIGDHPLLPSGVATQTKYMIEGLLESGNFEVISFGGAIKHSDYNVKEVGIEKFGASWKIIPVDGYGTPQQLRSLLLQEKPDILWFMTDPRFYEWLWQMESEIRKVVPMVYYHVWDNFPTPMFNKPFYESNDAVVTISKVTSEIVKKAAPEVEEVYLPHAVDPAIFKKKTDKESISQINELRKRMSLEDKVVFFWNNRNARRKQSGSLVYWFKAFLDKVGHDKAALIMHTDTNDPHGQPLEFLANTLGLNQGQLIFSKQKLLPDDLSKLYNLADCVLNIADAEGFGLSSLEALSCSKPVINTMTGGLQEQVTDGENWFGVGIEPVSKAIIGSQQVPYIYEDRLSEEAVVDALTKIYEMSDEERQKLGDAGREHVEKNYSFENYKKFWVDYLQGLHERLGSWSDRKNYTRWEKFEI